MNYIVLWIRMQKVINDLKKLLEVVHMLYEVRLDTSFNWFYNRGKLESVKQMKRII